MPRAVLCKGLGKEQKHDLGKDVVDDRCHADRGTNIDDIPLGTSLLPEIDHIHDEIDERCGKIAGIRKRHEINEEKGDEDGLVFCGAEYLFRRGLLVLARG